MKLIDLEPVWLSSDMFVFRSPTGCRDLITCKRVPMTRLEQYELIYRRNPQYVGRAVVQTLEDVVWRFEGNDFATMTVHPSVDHSASGNWHGFIIDGNIVGG